MLTLSTGPRADWYFDPINGPFSPPAGITGRSLVFTWPGSPTTVTYSRTG
jgi:hypothetical protein